MQPNVDDQDTYKILSNEYYDVLVAFKDVYKNDILVINIPSVNALQNLIDLTKTAIPLPSKGVVFYWQRLKGDTLFANEDTITYISKNLKEVNAAEVIKNDIYFKILIEQIRKVNPPIQGINKLFSNITGINLPLNSIDMWESKIAENKYIIKVRLLTALVYYGTDPEKKNALKELRLISNKNYSTEKEWYNYYSSLVYK